MKKLVVLGLAAASLCIVLAGCSDPAKAYIGTWEAVEVTEFGDTRDEATLEANKESGALYYFVLNEDGTAELTSDGKAHAGTWALDDEDVASFDSDYYDTTSLEVKDGQLVATYNSESYDSPITVVYKKIDPSEKLEAPSMEDFYNESESGIEDMRNDATVDDLSDATAMDVVAVDDGTCTIKAVGRGNYDGFPSIVVEITNKTDGTATFICGDGWMVGGHEGYPVLDASVRAGETASIAMLFTSVEFGGDVSLLEGTSGQIMVIGPVESNGVSPILAEYDIKF